ncbi:PucR family transcriptional regulator [Clostridium cylindrosporum]|uniref:Purine catabolism regulatory protein PucR n=1 Tax=Clostridium cylindrosporum DSM 605 TaxID=1121307 RepID=A0A0J8D7U6_CLOCY|nr:PucR family transcriptional regulator [Clostridium cylindrosporum]KMT22115.1 purine catabolism regulatory protein PucR [Clostridium cylindrosporum DSM 605]
MIKNGVTIDDILKMECMKESRLVAGSGGENNIITQVNVMADPDVLNWVDEGELLLTTAYSFNADNMEEQMNLIKECSKKKLAGIGIKIYPYLNSLPDEVIQLANELKFPIIDLYYATALSDIITPIFREIFNRQAYILQKIESIHKQMTNAILMGASVEDMANVIFDHIKNPIFVKLDFPEKSIYKSSSEDLSIKSVLIKNAEGFNQSIMKITDNNIYESKEFIRGAHVSRVVMPITIKNNVYGHVFAWGINSSIQGIDISILESASTTIALEVLKNLSIREVENKYRAEFLDDLLSIEERRSEKALERASFFDIGIEDKSLIILISIKDEVYKKDDISRGNNQENITKIVHFIEKSFKDLSLKGIVAGKTESIIVLLSFKKDTEINYSLGEFVKFVNEMFEKRFSEFSFKMGIGRSYLGLEKSYKSYKDALEAIAAGEILGEGNIVYFENLGIYKILCQENLREEIEKFYKMNLEPLVEYDSKKSTELVKTLEAYFEHNGNLKKMSDALFTHYNTILYRLSRIKEITGVNFENAKDRLNLEIALKIKMLLKK